jgi:lipopolysaccharide/colanic/teichoic acid biosynthesis glycosyltransferase
MFLLCPVFLLVLMAVKLHLGAPVFFIKPRAGHYGKPFDMLKFRSMTDEIDRHGSHLPDEKRLTRLGKLLRSTSLDEIPNLWNVLKGDMSLVGPRPLLLEYTRCYSVEQARRLETKPGITGWAQVNGRNAISWEEKFNCDVWYVENQSLWLDMKIIWLTIKKVVLGEGVSADNHATMPKFTGSKN